MSDWSLCPIKECFRSYRDGVCAAFADSLAEQLLADHDAEVERKAEREALIWATGAMSLNERDNAIIQRRIDELEQP